MCFIQAQEPEVEDSDEESNEAIEDDDEDANDHGDTDEEEIDEEAEAEAVLAAQLPHHRAVAINKIRKIYKVFKMSPKSNDKLQRCIKEVLIIVK